MRYKTNEGETGEILQGGMVSGCTRTTRRATRCRSTELTAGRWIPRRAATARPRRVVEYAATRTG